VECEREIVGDKCHTQLSIGLVVSLWVYPCENV
jgi:hypothetical protein